MIREDILKRTFDFNGCLIWLGSYNSDGYPRGYIDGDENAKLHREIFFLFNGYYPNVVRHTCDNTTCLNPDHLIGGDCFLNIADRHSRNRTFNQISELEKQIVRNMRSDDKTLQEIADNFGYSFKRIEYINNKYVKEN